MLAHSVLSGPSREPRAYMLFLHGILGTRANWRGVARSFVKDRPDWGAVLVDLREHGDSLGMEGSPTLRQVAADVRELESSLGLPIGGALGHSFGGKVTLEWLRARADDPTEAWVIDASPSPMRRDSESSQTEAVIEMLQAMPRTWSSRDEFVAAVVQAGQPESIAQWLAMNLQRLEDGRRSFGPDLDVIRALIDDYARTDCWDVVEALPAESTLDVVIGGRSNAVSQSDRARLAELAERNPRLHVHVVEQAGHWVHVDAEEELLKLLTSRSGPQP